MASAVVKSIGQHLGNLLVDEVKSLYGVKDKIESLRTELEWVECFLRDADTHQHQETIICKWVSQVRDFAYDGEDIIERYLHEVTHHRQDGIRNTLKWFSCILFTCDAWTLHNLGSEIENLTVRMSDLSSRLQRYGIQVIRPTRSLEYNTMINREERRTYSHTEEDVFGLEEDTVKIVAQLQTPEVKVVAISGIGGLGKTTLARKVFKHEAIKTHFNDTCVWVYISKECDSTNIYREILFGLEKDGEMRRKIRELSIAELLRRIHELLRNQKCLVVLDDIWTAKAWESLKHALDLTRVGSLLKIFLTTRNKDLVKKIHDSAYHHSLKILSPEDSWKLLLHKVFPGRPPGITAFTGGESSQNVHQVGESSQNVPQVGESSQNIPQGGESSSSRQNDTPSGESSQNIPQVGESNQNVPQGGESSSSRHNVTPNEFGEMEKLGKEMLKHCNGLPLAIVALGGILSTKRTVSEWEDVRTNLSSYLMGPMEQEGTKSAVLEILELSYNDLPFYLKPCFLYLGNFSEDCEISTHELYRLWRAEGFLPTEGKSRKKGRTTYDIGEIYLNELVQRSMVQVGRCWTGSGRIKTCRVHDVMRDMCLRKCEEVSFLSHVECTESEMKSVPPFSVEISKSFRCAVHGGDLFGQVDKIGDKATCLRSLLVFNKKCILGRKIWEFIPLLRVLHLPYTDGLISGLKYLIHLRYLSVKGFGRHVDIPCLLDLIYLETLYLKCKGATLRNDVFCSMKRLTHLYLPYSTITVQGGTKLTFPTGGQMETIKNFHPGTCEMKELEQMTNLRVFSIRRGYPFENAEELKQVLEVMKKAGQLINNFRVTIHEDLINQDPQILSSVEFHPSFHKLTILGPGRLDKDESKDFKFPKSLSWVHLKECKTTGLKHLISGLEKLPMLGLLIIRNETSETECKICFSPLSFQTLTELCIVFPQKPPPTLEWEVGEKLIIPNLQYLRLVGCKKLVGKFNLPDSLINVEILNCGETVIRWMFSESERRPNLKVFCVDGYQGTVQFVPDTFCELPNLYIGGKSGCSMVLNIDQGALPDLRYLSVRGWEHSHIVGQISLPRSLTWVKLIDCEIWGTESGRALLSCLEQHRALERLDLEMQGMPAGRIIRFDPESVSRLIQLHISIKLPKQGQESEQGPQEWELDVGALSCLEKLDSTSIYLLKTVNNLPNSLKEVNLEGCQIGNEQILHSLSVLGNLKLLRLTKVQLVRNQGGKVKFTAGDFPRLTQLHLSLTDTEQGKWEWEVENGALPVLEHLELHGCKNLKKWTVGNGALPVLKHLKLQGCKNLKKLPQGLPNEVAIECDPCINGIQNYKSCPHAPLSVCQAIKNHVRCIRQISN